LNKQERIHFAIFSRIGLYAYRQAGIIIFLANKLMNPGSRWINKVRDYFNFLKREKHDIKEKKKFDFSQIKLLHMKKVNLLLICIAVTNIIMAQAPAITYPSGSLTYTINTAITPFQPSNSGGAVPTTIPGAVTTLAGSTSGYLNGTGTSAKFNTPTGVAIDASGNVYVADQLNHMIRKITPAGAVSTIAGNGSAGFADGTGSSTQFNTPVSVAIDASGNLYVADQLNHRIRKITQAGVVTTFAGSGVAGFSDNTGILAQFNTPSGVVTDASGNVYVGDKTNQRIRKITPAGVVTTLAGAGTASFVDATGASARFNNPMGVATDASGNVYVADNTNFRVRKITSAGVTTTFAGWNASGFLDGTGINAILNYPTGVATDASGNVYVADMMNNRIRKITPAGVVTSLAGCNTVGYVDGTGGSAQFNSPQGVATDASGNVYVADAGNSCIRKITPFGYSISPALPAGLNFDGTTGIISGTPTVPISTTSYMVTAVNSKGTSTFSFTLIINASSPLLKTNFVSGIGSTTGTVNGTIVNFGTDGSNPTSYGVCYSATNPSPTTADNVTNNGAISTTGDFTIPLNGLTPFTQYYVRVYAANTGGTGYGNVVLFITAPSVPSIAYPSDIQTYAVNASINPLKPVNNGGAVPATIPGIVSTYAGSLTSGYTDGTLANAKFNAPTSLAIDASGNLYVYDGVNNRFRKITPGGIVTTLAGSVYGYADGTGANAKFLGSAGIQIDPSGNLFVTDAGNNCIRKITPDGVVTTFAGNTTSGSLDATGTSAQFNNPTSLAIDASGNMFVTDQANFRIRKITPAGVVTTLAGSTKGNTDGIGTSAKFDYPYGITIDVTGNLYVTENNISRIRKITPAGVVTTYAGSSYGTADGPVATALFTYPAGITTDLLGNMYITDNNSHRIRKITPAGIVSTLAGNTATAGYVDGPVSTSKFNNPRGIATDASGNVYVADQNNNCIRKITMTGYTISPSLPAGLSFDATTGIVSGTPAVPMVATTYTVTATNGGGTSTSVFTILINADFPTVKTYGATASGATTATCNGSINSFGTSTNPSAYGVCYSSTNSTPTTADNVINNGATSTTGDFTVSLTGLTPLTQYYVRAYATTTGGTTYGDIVVFTTTQAAPIITYPAGSQVYTANTAITPFQPTNTGGAVPASIFSAVSTFAGGGPGPQVDGTGTLAQFAGPGDVATDGAGNIYVVDVTSSRIRKITPAGVVTTLAGNGSPGRVDGPGSSAQFKNPLGIAVDALGNVYVSDAGNNCIRKITPSGMVSTIAGSGTYGFADGIGSQAQFKSPSGIAIDAVGNLFVADVANNCIRKITPAGVVTSFAGNGNGYSGSADGTGINASFYYPKDVTFDSSGNLFVADNQSGHIRKITPAGVVTTLKDGTGTTIQLSNPISLVFDGPGNLYVSEYGNHHISKITPAGVVTTFAGSTAGLTNGIGVNAQFNIPEGIAIDASGILYLAEQQNNLIRKIQTCGYSISPALPAGLSFDGTTGIISGTPTTATQAVTPYAVTAFNTGGASTFSFTLIVNAPTPTVETSAVNGYGSTTATISGTILTLGTASNPTAYGICYSTTNTMPLITDNVVNNGAISVTGSYTASITGLTPSTLYYVRAYATNNGGTSYGTVVLLVNTTPAPPVISYSSGSLTYTVNSPITPFQPTNSGGAVPATIPGTVSTLAGSTSGFLDATGTSAKFTAPWGVALDVSGNVFVGDQTNNRIRKITPAGVVTTLAGSGTSGFLDNVTGTSAQFYYPEGVSLDAAGNVYVGDYYNNRIRKVTPAGAVTTLAGTSSSGNVDGTGTSAQFYSPYGVATDASGNVYVADQNNYRIRKITPGGVVTTFAGSTQGTADGTGTQAKFYSPNGVAIDAVGNVYVSDMSSYRIRKITPAGIVTTLAGSTQGFVDGTGSAAKFYNPKSVATDAAGNIYVGDTGNNCIRKITPQGVVTTLAGGSTFGSTDGIAAFATFNAPVGVATDAAGNVYVADQGNNRIRTITPYGYSISPALPAGLSFDATTGFISGTPTAQLATTSYTITATNVGGTSTFGFTLLVNAPYPMVQTYGVSGIKGNTATANGTIYNFGTSSNPSAYGVCYSSLNNSPNISDNVVSNGPTSATGDFTVSLTGLTPLTLYYVRAYATNSGGTAYGDVVMFNTSQSAPVITYPSNTQTYLLNTAIPPFQPTSSGGAIPATNPGVVSTFAGSTPSGSTDASGTAARFSTPASVATDAFGNIYVADYYNNRIRKITSSGVVTTLAGSTSGYADGTGASAKFYYPQGVATDVEGNVYVGDANNNCIRKITPAGVVSTLAGRTTAGYADGPGNQAMFNSPTNVATDLSGNVYVGDQYNNCIRKITPTGVVSTFAGSTQGFADGTGTAAKFYNPRGVTTDASGNVYVADAGNHLIRKITSGGVVSTIAGSTAGYADGTGGQAQFYYPVGIVSDASCNLYVTESTNNRIRKITSAGVVTTVAGSGKGYSDGIGVQSQINNPWGVTIDALGNVFVADGGNNSIREITTTGYSITPALPAGLSLDGTTGIISGTPTVQMVSTPYTVMATNTAGTTTFGFTLVVNATYPMVETTGVSGISNTTATVTGTIFNFGTDGSNPTTYGICYSNSNSMPTTADNVVNLGTTSATGTFTTSLTGLTPGTMYYARAFATNGGGSGYGPIVLIFNTTQPAPVISYPSGTPTFTLNTAITPFQPTNTGGVVPATISGNVSTFAGSATWSYADGTGTAALFNNPYGVANDASGNVYVADYSNNRIRKITPSGVVTTLAGSASYSLKDGTGTAAQFYGPKALAVDALGNVFVADQNNNCIRKITPSGVVSTFAGSGLSGFANGTGAAARISSPQGVAVDLSGNVYVADQSYNCIRKITPAGVVTTFAGSTSGYADGQGINAQFSGPTGITTDASGNVYVSDATNNRIRKITPDGYVTTLAGSTLGFLDGTGIVAQFSSPQGITCDRLGNLYVADLNNNRIRKITLAGIVTTIAGSGSASYADGIGTQAQLKWPLSVSIDALGNLYLVNSGNSSSVRKITTCGYSISPALPAGLSFDGTTGIISGTPTVQMASTPYTITATNAGGISTFSFTLLINAPYPMVETTGVSSITSTGATVNGTIFNFGSGSNPSANGVCYSTTNSNPTTSDNVVTNGSTSTTGSFATLLTGLQPQTKYYVRTYATNTGGTGYGTTVIIINTTPAAPAITYSSGSLTYTLNTAIVPIQPINTGGAVPASIPGTVSTFAGSTYGYTDANGILAKFSTPTGIATDVSDNVYVADQNNHKIRKITPTGDVSTLAGSSSGYTDATGTSAKFYSPFGLAIDAMGNLFVGDKNNQCIRQITSAGVVTTLAGNNNSAGSCDGTGTGAQFTNPQGVATDVLGNVYVADMMNYSIRKVTSSGVVSTLAGGTMGFADGSGPTAKFYYPQGIATDFNGNVYVADPGNMRIRKITSAGIVSTVAGSTYGFSDGPVNSALFNNPSGVVIDASGNLYVTDYGNNRIRQITPGGMVTTLAGSGTSGTADGTFATAQFNSPTGITIDAIGNMYVVDGGNNRIRKISRYGYSISPALPAGLNFDATTGIISGTPTVQTQPILYTVTATNVSGTNTFGLTLSVNAPNPMVETYNATGIGSTTSTVNGTIFNFGTASNASAYGVCYSTTNSTPTLADNVVNNGSTSATGDFTTLLTGLTPGTKYYVRAYATNSGGTGYANSVIVFNTSQVAPVISYPAGSLNYAVNTPIPSFQPTNSGGSVPFTIPGSVTTLAGSTQGYADGSGALSQFSGPVAVATDASGNVYVGDTGNKLIRKITPIGVVTTYAGSGALFNSPGAIATDASGNVYVADAGNNIIQKITSSGVVSTLAGSGVAGFANGNGILAQFSLPKGIAVDASGNVYVADQTNQLIRKITPQGIVTTLAGSSLGFADGTGSQAKFNLPTGIATDISGNVYVADQGNHSIRKITPAGVVTTLAGTGTAGFADGAGVSAQFSSPYSVAVNALGIVYVGDYGNNRIRQITPAGVVSILAGNNQGSADGTGTGARFNAPQGVATDAAGNVYVADYNNQLIRKITTNGYSISPALPAGLSFNVTNGFLSGTPIVTQSASSYTVTAKNNGGTYTASFTIAVMVPTVWTGAVNSDWNTAGNWSSGVPTALSNVSIPNVTNQPVVSASAVCNNIVINAGAVLTIPTATQLTVSGSITNNAGISGLVIKASDTGVAANCTLIFHNITSEPVPATVEMYSKASWDLTQAAGSKYRWQYLGIPVRSALAGPTLNGAIVRMAVESGMNSSTIWSLLNGSSTLSSFTGYEIVQATAQKYIFTGQLENSSLVKTLNYTTGAVIAGSNLLANPFTAAIDIKQLVFSGAAEASVYLYNTGSLSDWAANSGSNVGSNPGQYTVSTKLTAGTGGIPGQIPSMQGFLVKTPNNTGSTINIPYSAVTVQNLDRQRAPAVDKADNLVSDKVYSIIDVTGSRFGDRMWIFTDPTCTNGFDNGWDGRKMTGTPGTPQLCALGTDGEYQIDAVSDINNTELGFQAGEDENYTLMFTHNNMEQTYGALYLQDLLLNKTVDITATGSVYTFNAQQSSAYEKRFRIVTVPTGIINTDANTQLKVFTSGKTLFIHNRSDFNGDLMLYDMMGHFLQKFVFSANGITTIPTSLIPGAYVVKATTSGERTTKSLLIQ